MFDHNVLDASVKAINGPDGPDNLSKVDVTRLKTVPRHVINTEDANSLNLVVESIGSIEPGHQRKIHWQIKRFINRTYLIHQ